MPALLRRNRFLLPLVLATALAAALALAPAAGAEGLRILSPHNDRFFGSGPVWVKLRTARSVKSVAAKLEGKQVGSAFKRVAPGRWRAKLPPKRLRSGANHLVVSTAGGGGRDYDAVRFLVGKRHRGYLSLSLPQGGGTALIAQVSIGGATPRRLSATLNGRRLRWPLGIVSGRHQMLRLAANDGLRFGANRLTVFAARSDGVFDVERRRLLVTRKGPLVGAGRDRRAVPGVRVRLDGRSSRAALGPSATLGYRWQIVRKPAGSKAKLRRAGSALPLLRPDKPGTYRVRLTVTESGRFADGRPARRSGTDVATVTSVADVPPVGLPIETIDYNGGNTEETADTGITIGAKTYWMGMTQGNSIQAVILDRETLEPLYSASYPGTQANAEKLGEEVKKYGNRALVAISNPDLEPNSVVNPAFVPIVKSLGAPVKSIENGRAGWSVVGIPGSKGGAYLGSGLSYNDHGAGDLRGNLTGYLQEGLGGSNGFAYVPASRVTFDTDAFGSAPGQNIIRVGEASYASGALPGCGEAGKQPAGGLQLEVLLAETLTPVLAKTYTTNGCGAAEDGEAQKQMAKLLGELTLAGGITEGPKLVLVQSIGSPYDAGNGAWNELAAQLEKLGATGSVFGEARESYAFVGGLGLEGLQLTEASQTLSGKPARITGMLEPNRLNLYLPMLSSPSGGTPYELSAIAYQPPQPWPYSQSKEEKAALAYAARKLDLEAPKVGSSCYVPPQPDVRSEFCNLTYEGSWQGFVGTLEKVPWRKGEGFGRETWKHVRGELIAEFPTVQRTWKLVELLQGAFGASGVSAEVNLKKIALEIEEAIAPPAKSETAGWWLELLANVASIVSYYNFGIEEEIVQKSTGTLSGGLFIAAQMIFGPEGSPVAEEFKLKSDDVAIELAEKYLAASNGLGLTGELLVSDYGKLEALRTSGLLGIDSKALGKLKVALGPGSKQWSYQELLPAAYEAISLQKGEIDNNPLPKNASEYVCNYYAGEKYFPQYKPFEKAPEDAQLRSSAPSESLGVLVIKGSKLPNHDGNKETPRSPTKGLLEHLFEPVTESGKGLGFLAPWFWRSTFGYPGGETRVVNECP